MIPIPDLTYMTHLTGTSTNVLANTDFEIMPWAGTILVWAVSSNNTATIECTMDGHQAGRTSLLTEVTNATLLADSHAPFKMSFKSAGGKPVIVIGGTVGEVDVCVCGYKNKFI